MTNFVLPSHVNFASITIRQAQKVRLDESSFNFVQQVVGYGGQRWEADINLPTMTHADARVWLGFLAELKGPTHTFTMGDPAGATARGGAGGTPLVAGASQTGATLNIDGATTTQTGWMKAGDYIQLGSGVDARIHMVTTDADTALGATTLKLWPDMTVAPADNAAVVVASTVAAWRLATPVSWDTQLASLYGLSFSAVSVVS